MIGDDLLVTVAEIEAGRIAIAVSRRAFGGRVTFLDNVVTRWLSRDESAPLGDEVSCSLIDIRGNKVRLGFILPPNITLHRKEVYDVIRPDSRDDWT